MRKTFIKKWTLTGYWPHTIGNALEAGKRVRGVTQPMDAAVPGSVYKTLKNHGVIPDPYIGDNSLECEWVNNRWWMYISTFSPQKPQPGNKRRLVIEGLDYTARIYLNGKLLGRHEGVFVPFTCEIDAYIKDGEENELAVLFECTPSDVAQYGHTSQTFTQRSRFDYKWDFCTRIVGTGIYGNVYIEEHNEIRIVSAYVKPHQAEGNYWTIPGEFEIDMNGETERRIATEITLALDGQELICDCFEQMIQPGQHRLKLPEKIENPKLWWTNGAGEQPLYTYRIKLFEEGQLIDDREYLIGFRTLTYIRADDSTEDSLPYLLVVNGKRVYLKGVNVVPYDLLEKYATEEQYRLMLSQIHDAHINIVRVWGGGLIESEIFYRLCDEYGIAIWQEFIQSSSSFDSIPSKRPEFLQKLEETSRYAIKQRRNHPALAYWSGGNELCNEKFVQFEDRNDHPATFDDANIALLLQMVMELDPDTLMLPTSASGPREFLALDKQGTNHDVHGPWMYGGVLNHYTIYNLSDSILHSEFGCNGLSSIETLRCILPENLLGSCGSHSNMVWEHKGGSWWDSQERDEEVFGQFEFGDIEDHIKCSQFIQAEGIRYAVQANMRRAWQNCGSIIWQYNEPWPNAASTALTEYGCNRKLAYYFLRESYRSCYASIRYDKLCWKNNETFSGECFVYNEGEAQQAQLTATVSDRNGQPVFRKTDDIAIKANGAVSVSKFAYEISTEMEIGFYIELSLAVEGKKDIRSEYMFLIPDRETCFCSRQFVRQYYDRKMLQHGDLI